MSGDHHDGRIRKDMLVTPDELRDRILRWEDPHTDFKESVDSNSELAKDLQLPESNVLWHVERHTLCDR